MYGVTLLELTRFDTRLRATAPRSGEKLVSY